MARILVLQHVAHEILGTLNPLLRAAGFRIRYVNFGRHPDARPGLDGYQGLVILGGPMNVDQVEKFPHLRVETELIAQAIDREMPVLGICLGAQLIAKTLGAEVRAASSKEIGWHEVAISASGLADPLLAHFEEREHIFQWHGDTFDLPRGAEHLASSEVCTHQAFRYGRTVYGLQFHLEVDERLIERWLSLPALREEIAELGRPLHPEQIREDTRCHVQRARHLGDGAFGAFVKLFGLEVERPRRILSSR
jgi:GMP synthase (glutamine-hydrolysing)